MHKKLEAELVSLAHSILQMKNKDDVNALHKKAHDIYEKLSVLKFVDEYINTTPNAIETKEEIIDKIETVSTEDIKKDLLEEVEIKEEVFKVEEVEEKITESIERKALIEEEVFSADNDMIKDDRKELSSIQITLEEEFKDAISADVATQLFEKATKENPVIEEETNQKRSLNDTIFKNNLQIGLNDRIAFVKHLFDGSQEDFNRVLSQLNSFKTEEEALSFMSDFVKPDYDWSTKEDYEQRLMDIIKRKFS
ncbi:hypothetical protein [Lutibacter flavus]|uniref:Uncharacterized protein n=1 Tax=Lutibacter flavus TaxID=691689 RepID=A0A238X8J7_9FLAO|nr:hypothetical protein [Lutibacter flavus]SNR54938.1 hypothetical protein SAMN04488111_1663 [Lutibacter flavus]